MRRENLPPSAAPRMSESTFVTAVQWNYDDDKLIGGWNGDLNYSKKLMILLKTSLSGSLDKTGRLKMDL